MALILADRVKVRSRTTGLTDFTLENTLDGFQSFEAIGDGNTTYYGITDVAGNWEIGIGTYTASGPTLSRDTIISSSNAGSKVNFPVGSKNVFCTFPSSALQTMATGGFGNFEFVGSTISTVDTSDISLDLGSYTWTFGADGTVTLPGGAKITTQGTGADLVAGVDGWAELASNNGDSYVWVDDGGAYIVTNGSTSPYQWTFGNDGITSVQGPIRQSNSYTRTSGYGLSTPSEVVWIGSYDHISSVKLTIQVEADETGDDTGWHSQACEAIIASRGYGNGTYGYGDPIMTVYGVTYTSTVPLVTFSVQRNATTHLIELVATKTAAAGSNAQIQIHSVEMGTSD